MTSSTAGNTAKVKEGLPIPLLNMSKEKLNETVCAFCRAFTFPDQTEYEEATDEEFLLAALNSSAFDFWRTDEDDDLVDPANETPL